MKKEIIMVKDLKEEIGATILSINTESLESQKKSLKVIISQLNKLNKVIKNDFENEQNKIELKGTSNTLKYYYDMLTELIEKQGKDKNKKEFVKEYNYVVFKDEVGEIFVIRDLQLDTFLISGTYIGKLEEIERGTFEQPKENESYIGMLINKRKEWLLKLAEKQNKVTDKKVYNMKNIKNVIKSLLVGMVITGCMVNSISVKADVVNPIDTNIINHYTLTNGDMKTLYKDGSYYINSDVEIQSISYIDNSITINKDGELYSFYVNDPREYYLAEMINVTMNNNAEIIDCSVDSQPIVYNNISVIYADNKVCCIRINDNVYSFVNEDSSWSVNDKVNVIMQDDEILEVRPYVNK